MITLTGKKVAEGIAVGRLTFYKRGKKEKSNHISLKPTT
mgnify:CR=1 FL=1